MNKNIGLIPGAGEERLSEAARFARERRFIAAIVLVVSLFFLWGTANNLNDVLVAKFKKLFVLSDFQSGLVQSVFYFGYFLWAIPASLLTRRFGYKAGIVFGLLAYGVGALLFLPAADVRQYPFFLTALFVIATGLAFLETSANPLIAILGSPETSARRLNFAQSFNSLGAVTGVLIGRSFILTGVEPTDVDLKAMSPDALESFYAFEAAAVKGPYLWLGLGVIMLAAIAFLTRFPPQALARAEDASSQKPSFLALLHHRTLVTGVIAQFLYVGAQVGVWSFMIRYAQHNVSGMGEKTAAAYLTASLIAFMIGRFASTALMGVVAPHRLLAIYALCNAFLCFVAFIGSGMVGLCALAATSFFMSLMFPTIFALSIKGLDDLTKYGSSLLIMSIIGGAVITAIMGLISDFTSINSAMSAPMLCFFGVLYFARSVARKDAGA